MLVLHIGTAKAGSTTLQAFLKENRSRLPLGQLEAFGVGNAWKIAATSGTKKSHWYWVTHTKRLTEAEHADLRLNFWQEVAEEYSASGFDGIIASSEFIYGEFADDQNAIRILKRNLENIFGGIKIVVYFRNQIEFVKSAYAQAVMGPRRETMPFNQYILNLDQIGIPIHYATRLRVWGSVFGWKNICPVVFDPGNFPNGSLIEDFCHRTGMAYGPAFASSASLKRNASPSASQLEQRRLLNCTLAGPDGHSRTGDGRRVGTEPGDDLCDAYDRMLIDKVSDGNRWLNDTFFSDWALKLPVSE